jgi:hypothetical protein
MSSAFEFEKDVKDYVEAWTARPLTWSCAVATSTWDERGKSARRRCSLPRRSCDGQSAVFEDQGETVEIERAVSNEP